MSRIGRAGPAAAWMVIAGTLAFACADVFAIEPPPPAPQPPAQVAKPTTPRFGLAVDVISIWSLMARFRFEARLRDDLQFVALLGGGSPTRSNFDRYSLLELGAGADWFALGDRRLGLGPSATLRWRTAGGARDARSFSELPPVKVSANAGLADIGFIARAAAASGMFADARLTIAYVVSTATAKQDAAAAPAKGTAPSSGQSNAFTTTLNYPTTLFAIHFGWMF